ncbi:MAG: Sugar fermentation stimulation protein A [Candidatus Celerinatantimonas neptuna]|nr:MAG: Sugar fermentation stimulation protein A [Candidatus Celerinatantimonas neptuna]
MPDGSCITAHCANTGAMTGCAEPGWKVWLRDSQNPKRKCRYSWELCENDQGHMICINTARANEVVAEAIEKAQIERFQKYTHLKREVRYGQENSRIDILLSGEQLPDCYIEVKSVTLLAEQGLGLFPDAPSVRGQKHLRELTEMAQNGHRAILFFAIMHSGIEKVTIAHHIDARYGELLKKAILAGVEVVCHRFCCKNEQITHDCEVSFALSEKPAKLANKT